MSDKKQDPKFPSFDDRLSRFARELSLETNRTDVKDTFVLARIHALEKPPLMEELIDPSGNDPCGCNAVCGCVPADPCGCNQVCTCDAVDPCAAFNAGGGGCIGYGVTYVPCT